MNKTLDPVKFESLLDDSNYIGAYTYLKFCNLPIEEHTEYAGRVVSYILVDLDQVDQEDKTHRVLYLRSLLAWILKDIPGLAPLYSEQTHSPGGETGFLAELLAGLQEPGSIGPAFEKAFSELKNSIERRARESGIEDLEGRIRQFTEEAEQGFREGVRELGKVLRDLNSDMNTTQAGSDTAGRSEPIQRVEIRTEQSEDEQSDG